MSAIEDLAYRVQAETIVEDRAVGVVVDVHYFKVAFTEAAADRDGFIAAMRDAIAAPGVFCDVSEADLRLGISYIKLGGWIGDQGLALRLLALGQLYGVWKVVLPEAFGFASFEARAAAGAGVVLNSGWQP